MDYVKPADVAVAMAEAGERKLALSPRDLLIRGMLSGAILGVATSLAFTGAVQTNVLLVGALIFPVGLICIVLLGLELITGSFALVPLPWLDREATGGAVLINWGWVFIGNLIGSVAYGALLAIALTNMGTAAPTGVAARIVQIAELKTIGYSALGFAGMVTVFVKAILCNWMVCLAIVLAMTTSSTVGKIACAWMPVFIFFAQGFEHSVVNMFIIPTGMMMGAKVTVADWWLWNQNSGHARQSGRRLHFHRPCHLRDLQTARARQAHGADADRRARRIACSAIATNGGREHTEDLMSGDFEPEQKRYLEGFMAGLQIAKSGAFCDRPCRRRAVGADRPRCRGVARPGSRHQGRRQAVGSGKIQARAQSARRLRAAQAPGRQQRSAEARRQFPLAVFRLVLLRAGAEGLHVPGAHPTASSLIGSSPGWPASPNAMPAATPTSRRAPTCKCGRGRAKNAVATRRSRIWVCARAAPVPTTSATSPAARRPPASIRRS